MSAKTGHALEAKLEALHMLAVEAEAFHTAFDDVYHRGLWSTEDDPDHRRDINHMECFLEHLRETIAQLLAETQAAVEMAIHAPRRKRGRHGD